MKIGIIGLGYVGLPLAVEFAKIFSVVGFDINTDRVAELNQGKDSTLEVEDETLKSVLRLNDQKGLHITTKPSDLTDCTVYIVTVPTPVNKNNQPVLTPLVKASETVGEYLSKGDLVVYESTVYPGVTEDICVPILEKTSGLVFNEDFFCGYSPERINPGDKTHTLTKIRKVTSGSTPEAAQIIDDMYAQIITAGTFKASSIKVAESAKVIENAQRDINIAFVNELAKIFSLLDIDTHSVLEAAGTKWNFLPFKPGLVGGHCIGVDPYYLAQKAQEVGYHTDIILSGRRINDSMGKFVVSEVVKLMIQKGIMVKEAKVLVLGMTFKENCPDIRNTRIVDILQELKAYDIEYEIYDPWASPEEVKREYGESMIVKPSEKYDAIIHAVQHEEFSELDYNKLLTNPGVLYDVKASLTCESVDKRL